MSNNNAVRNEFSRLAQQIENLARQVQDKIASGVDVNGLLAPTNELIRNSSTLTFAFGEMAALEENSKTVKTTVVSNPSGTKPRNYHNVRDSFGRFSRV